MSKKIFLAVCLVALFTACKNDEKGRKLMQTKKQQNCLTAFSTIITKMA